MVLFIQIQFTIKIHVRNEPTATIQFQAPELVQVHKEFFKILISKKEKGKRKQLVSGT